MPTMILLLVGLKLTSSDVHVRSIDGSAALSTTQSRRRGMTIATMSVPLAVVNVAHADDYDIGYDAKMPV